MVCIIWAPKSALTVAKWVWLQHFRSTLHSHLQTAITSSFQLQIEHRLKLWTPDFPRFETRYSTHEINFGKWSKYAQQFPKWGGANFAQCSHSYDFRTEILGRDREHAFWKMLTKENSHKGMCCVKISHKGNGWCEFCCVLAFLPCFPLFSP